MLLIIIAALFLTVAATAFALTARLILFSRLYDNVMLLISSVFFNQINLILCRLCAYSQQFIDALHYGSGSGNRHFGSS